MFPNILEWIMQNNVEGLQLEEEKAQHEKEEPVKLTSETTYEPHKNF